ncbi:MAG TPA: antitoxin Xre/MbcA/ParS toxin-binding domain-containing protein [Vicinamibacterales bacterium]|jgi:putative toxin-antitoxin system antitoxin component (TIGR02293 family)|nr:antitoxin Xre/MbcA/ParS toxin-binding domain-containing protein [Vicinamibacterales bacterium]
MPHVTYELSKEVVLRVAEVLGGSEVLHTPIRTWIELDQAVRAGLPKRSLQLVARRVVESGESANDFVYSVVPSATYKRRSKLSLEESQRTERLARVIALTEALWDDQQEARAFLNRAHPLLDGETPLNVARTELGARRVEQLLHEIEHGLPL